MIRIVVTKWGARHKTLWLVEECHRFHENEWCVKVWSLAVHESLDHIQHTVSTKWNTKWAYASFSSSQLDNRAIINAWLLIGRLALTCSQSIPRTGTTGCLSALDTTFPHVQYLVSSSGCAPPPLVGFVRARQSFTTLHSSKILVSQFGNILCCFCVIDAKHCFYFFC